MRITALALTRKTVKNGIVDQNVLELWVSEGIGAKNMCCIQASAPIDRCMQQLLYALSSFHVFLFQVFWFPKEAILRTVPFVTETGRKNTYFIKRPILYPVSLEDKQSEFVHTLRNAHHKDCCSKTLQIIEHVVVKLDVSIQN